MEAISMFNKMRLPLLISAVLLLLSGCSGAGSKPQGSLKIAVSGDSAFLSQAGLTTFQEQFPDVELQLINPGKLVEQPLDLYRQADTWITEQQPDVIVADQTLFSVLAQKGYYYNLDTLMKKDQISYESMYPAVTEWIRGQSLNGELAGAAPAFGRTALFYNQSLFDELHVSLPQDQMSWTDVLQTAARFSAHEPKVYGLHDGYSGEPELLASAIGAAHKLSFWDFNTRRMTLDSAAWSGIYRDLTAAVRSGAIYNRQDNPEENGSAYNLFVQGKVAMVLGGYDMAKKLQAQPPASLQWGVVTQPVDPADPGYGDISIPYVFGISANAGSLDLAWQFVSFMLRKEQAGVYYRQYAYLPSDQDLAPEGTAPFYKLTSTPLQTVPFWELPADIQAELQKVRRQGFAAMLGGQPVDTVLQDMQLQGQLMLDQWPQQ